MMVFRGRFSFPKLDAKKYTDALEQQCEIQIRQAAREWLRAVIPRVPVWTGTARGSLQPLGRFLRVAVPINPTVTRKGMGPGVGASQGSFKFEKRQRRFLFKFNTEVLHFQLNEFYKAPPEFHLIHETPWHALVAGEEAFNKYVKEVLPKRIPKIKDFIKYKTRRFGP